MRSPCIPALRFILSVLLTVPLMLSNAESPDDPEFSPASHYEGQFSGKSATVSEPAPAPAPAPTAKPAKPGKGKKNKAAAQNAPAEDDEAPPADGGLDLSRVQTTSPLIAPDAKPSEAALAIARWATQPSTGPEGRPLPLAGTWDTTEWSSAYLAEMIQKGHYVNIAFPDPSGKAIRASTPETDELIRTLYKPALEFARANRLPIVFRGWNWAESPVKYQKRKQQMDKVEIPTDQLANILVNGKPDKKGTDPFGPIEAWEDWGRFWMGNEMMKQIQAIYPDPPLVIFLNNNEAGEMLSSAGVEKQDRFLAKFGPGPHSTEFLNKAVREGYAERYAAMFKAGNEALVEPAWKKNIRYIAYNTIAGAAYIGNEGAPKPGLHFDSTLGWTQWRLYNGSMPESYDNDWQAGKRDNRPGGMQTEAGGLYAMQKLVFAEDPDFFWTSIIWDGGVVSEVFRVPRQSSKTYVYATSGQRWSFERYEGWTQFVLWATRPRMMYEFRGMEPMDAMRNGTWMAMVNSTDRVWTNPVLGEFWRFGELVPNTAEDPWFNDLRPDAPKWLKDLKRWYLLTCDANPPRKTWENGTILNVFAQALVLGKAPHRRWLVYAHAPNGAVANATVKLPDFGDVKLPSVPLSGSFFTVEESGRSIKPLLEGGPEQLTVRIVKAPNADKTDSNWFKPGQPVPLEAAVGHAPGKQFTKFTWRFGDGETLDQKVLAGVRHTFKKPGVYMVGVEAHTADGPALMDQVAVYVGNPPDESVVYDLPLDEAIAWRGPWQGVGENGRELATYQHVPNRGSVPNPILTGGKFVDDPERGRVLELNEETGGIWLVRNKETVLREKSGKLNKGNGGTDVTDRTISFWFKAEDVNKRQVLYAEGFAMIGVNIYLDQGRLYAGSWATSDNSKLDSRNPVYGYGWNGDWISTEPLEAGRWYHVTWMLRGGTNSVQPDCQSLYLNGKLVGRAPGASLPVEYIPPRVGRTNMGGDDSSGKKRSVTRFHDQETIDSLSGKELKNVNALPTFRGRIDDFKFLNKAVENP